MINIICASTDLGVHVDGTDKGPKQIAHLLNNKKINEKIMIDKKNVIKEKNHDNLQKNINEIKEFLMTLFTEVDYSFRDKKFPITLGGDHTVAISSILAAKKHYDDLGVIWIDAHTDFNTFETTETGNIHGLPLASACGLCENLTQHFTSKYVNPQKCVVVGARSIDKGELNNLKEAGVTFFTTNELQKEGIDKIMTKAFNIAGKNIHISYDLDVIDPIFAPGVSVPEKHGITQLEAIKIIEYLKTKKDNITSFDLVEYNPSFDHNEVTLKIALDLLSKLIDD